MGSSVLFDDAEHAETAGFLAQLYDDEVATVLSYTQTRRYARGEVAVRRGEHERGLFVITAGSFEVVVATPSGPQRARLFQPGDVFGELRFLGGKPRSADVRAVEDSEALIMTPAAFDRLRLTHPRLALCFALDLGRILSVRFRECSRRLAALDQP